MAEIKFVRLGGDVMTTDISENITVGQFIEKNGMKVKDGDDLRIGGKSVTKDTVITPDQATLIIAAPKVKGA